MLSSLLQLYTVAAERAQVTVYFTDSDEPAATGTIEEITEDDEITTVKIAGEYFMYEACTFY